MSETRIEIILGPMFAGKSSELIRRTGRYKSIGKNVLLINHSYDIRTDNNVQTHSKYKERAIKVSSLMDLLDKDIFKHADVIGIDEAQFFNDLYNFVVLAEKYNKIIIVSGLDGDYKRQPIGQILNLIPLCDNVVKLNAYDMIDKDGSPGIFTKRIIDSDKQIVIGAEKEHIAVSRKNFLL